MICESDYCIQLAHVLPKTSRFVTEEEEGFTSGAKYRIFANGYIPIKVIS